MALGYYRLRKNSKNEFYLSGPIYGRRFANYNASSDYWSIIRGAKELGDKLRTHILIKYIPDNFASCKNAFKLTDKNYSPIPLGCAPDLSYSDVYRLLEPRRMQIYKR